MAIDEQKRKRTVFGLLVAAIIFGLIMRPWESRRKRGSDATSNETDQIATPMVEGSTAPPGADTCQQTLVFAASWPHDPFLQVEVKGAPSGQVEPSDIPSRWKLQGIMSMSGEQTCVINGQMCTVGVTIDGWKISHIGSSEVHLQRASRSVRLVLP